VESEGKNRLLEGQHRGNQTFPTKQGGVPINSPQHYIFSQREHVTGLPEIERGESTLKVSRKPLLQSRSRNMKQSTGLSTTQNTNPQEDHLTSPVPLEHSNKNRAPPSGHQHPHPSGRHHKPPSPGPYARLEGYLGEGVQTRAPPITEINKLSKAAMRSTAAKRAHIIRAKLPAAQQASNTAGPPAGHAEREHKRESPARALVEPKSAQSPPGSTPGIAAIVTSSLPPRKRS